MTTFMLPDHSGRGIALKKWQISLLRHYEKRDRAVLLKYDVTSMAFREGHAFWSKLSAVKGLILRGGHFVSCQKWS